MTSRAGAILCPVRTESPTSPPARENLNRYNSRCAIRLQTLIWNYTQLILRLPPGRVLGAFVAKQTQAVAYMLGRMFPSSLPLSKGNWCTTTPNHPNRGISTMSEWHLLRALELTPLDGRVDRAQPFREESLISLIRTHPGWWKVHGCLHSTEHTLELTDGWSLCTFFQTCTGRNKCYSCSHLM